MDDERLFHAAPASEATIRGNGNRQHRSRTRMRGDLEQALGWVPVSGIFNDGRTAT